MADDKELVRRRGSYKGQLTLFSTYLGTLRESSLTQAEANQLQLRIGKIEALYELYDDVQIQLECTTDNLDAHMTDRADFQTNYFSLLSRGQEMLNNYNKKREEFESCTNRESRSSGNHKLVKLPSISLPKFNGMHQNWLCFRNTFASLIHSYDDIDNINKFHYLRASLEGSAALVIQSVDFSSNNYEIAWNLLCDRFDNKRLLLQNHVSALFNIEPVTRESSVQLKRIIDEVNKNLKCLESLGEPVKQWDTLLIHIISNKLDSRTYRQWEEHKGRLDKNKPISLDNFIIFMRNRADLIETLELSSAAAAGQSGQPAKTAQKHRTMLSTQNTEHYITSLSSKACPKCDGDHNLSGCSQFLAMTNEERLELLPSFKVCFNCFRSGHYANQCKKPGCKVCKRRHNSLVHVDAHRQNTDVNHSSNSADVQVTTNALPPAAASGSEQVSLSTIIDAPLHSHSLDGPAVLLSTALIKVYDNNNREYIAKAVLDSGSTSSIMTERMCRQLNLHTDCVDKSVVGINNTMSHVGKTCRVLMRSLNENYSTLLHCFVLPSITGVIPSRQVDLSGINIPSDLCLADPNFHTPSEIDFIIGADLFWDLLGSRKIHLGSGKPTLFESRLGYLLGGPVNSGQVSTPLRTINCNFMTVTSSASNGMLQNEIENRFPRFWQLEEVRRDSSHYSPKEILCDERSTENTTRLDDGCSTVRLPLQENPNVLGNSIKFKASEPQLTINFDQLKSNLNIQSTEPSKTSGLSWQPDSDDYNRDSNLSRLNNPVAHTLCFSHLCKKQIPATSYLTESALKTELHVIIDTLLINQPIPKHIPLFKCNGFLDQPNLMRVGSRFGNPDCHNEENNLIILIVHSNHRSMKCQLIAPLTGHLTDSRLAPGMVLGSVGVDCADTMTSASRQGRGCRFLKVYWIIFEYCSMKAVDLNFVGDLTSNNSLSALHCFVSRRDILNTRSERRQ